MSGLILKLAPNERVLINGAVIENGPRKTRVTVLSEGVSVLRLRDALHPEEAIGPVSRAYHLAQIGVAGEGDPEAIFTELSGYLDDLNGVFEGAAAAEAVRNARDSLSRRDFYRTLRALRPLLPLERALLSETVDAQEARAS